MSDKLSNNQVKNNGNCRAKGSENPELGDAGLEKSPQSDHSRLNWLRFVRDRRWSILQKHQLLDKLGSPDNIYQTSLADLLAMVDGRQSKNNQRESDTNVAIKRDLAWLTDDRHSIICFGDSDYPALLKEIADPPIALFAIGNKALLAEPKVAIVGSRRPTPVGAKVTQSIASNLSQLGVVVTSGMALGIDGLAHQAALTVGAPTIAVMGCGLDTIYPSRHRSLFEKISQQGLVLSEYPLGVPAAKHTFPQRNRIVSGLSYGVVIVEAADRSGTLITARLAVEQNREVMVVPGSSVSRQYVGSHRLLQQGASLVLNGLDVVQTLAGQLQDELINYAIGGPNCSVTAPVDQTSTFTQDPDDADHLAPEKLLLQFISVESTTVDCIIQRSGLTAADVSSMLLMLELKGLVTVGDDGGYLNIS